jgi:Divergent InlB B-repeat domain
MMMKRLSATALLVLSASACRSHDKVTAANPDQAEVPATYTAKVVDVRDIEFLTPAERDAKLGLDWRGNRAISQHLTPDVPVELDMSQNREIVLNYEKQFALTVKAVSARGQGTVSIGSKWAKVGDVIDFEALEDNGARFTGWEGDIDGEGIKVDGKKISVKMDRPRSIRAMFTATKADLAFVSEFGAPKGAGTYELGAEVEWSVTSPWAVSEGVQMVATAATGKIKLDADAKADPGWKRQVRVAASSSNIVSGSTQGSDGWVDADSEISVNAVPADESYGFIKWEGVPADVAAQNPLKIKAAQPLSPIAVFEKQKFRLAVLTEFGKITGDGLHPKDQSITWSVETPVEIAPGIRKVARNAGGTIKMNTNKTYRIDWDTEVLLEVAKKTAAGEVVVRHEWIPVGKMVKGVTVERNKEEAAPLWEGEVERNLAREEKLDLKMDRPRRLVANFTPEPSSLLAKDAAGTLLLEQKTFKPESAHPRHPVCQRLRARRSRSLRPRSETRQDRQDRRRRGPGPRRPARPHRHRRLLRWLAELRPDAQ